MASVDGLWVDSSASYPYDNPIKDVCIPFPIFSSRLGRIAKYDRPRAGSEALGESYYATMED